jgi:hypothetical protein
VNETYTRPQLEAAARAAGYTLREVYPGQVCIHPEGVSNMPWEPWASDTDAFRLQAAVGMDIVTTDYGTAARHSTTPGVWGNARHVDHGGDRCASLRHAILRAAILRGVRLPLPEDADHG